MATINALPGDPRPYNVKKTVVQYAMAVTGCKYVTHNVLASAPVIISGHGVPSDTLPSGSIYLRKSGAAGARLYVTSGGGVWAAVAGV